VSALSVALIDYGAGNLRSVENALREVGAPVTVTRDPRVVAGATHIVVPGQGSMPACAAAMRSSGVAEAFGEAVRRGTRVLGICVGLQILLETGEEGGGAQGLGLIPGRVIRLPATVKLPHIGWSPVRAVGEPHPLLAPLDGQHLYFAHSYAAPADCKGTQLLAVHGRPFCAALAIGNLFAVQFHPEKSQQVGLALLERFVRL
jgi:imidazole glycerol-phosphate synthase subunit HisH